MINYTPLNLEKLTEVAPPVAPSAHLPVSPKPHRNPVNLFLLLIALVTAVVFAVLLFVLVQKRRGAGAVIVPETPIISPTIINLPTPTLTQTVLSIESVASESLMLTPKASEKTASPSPLLTPELLE